MPEPSKPGWVFRSNVICEVIKILNGHNVIVMGIVSIEGQTPEHVCARYYSLNSLNVDVSGLSVLDLEAGTKINCLAWNYS